MNTGLQLYIPEDIFSKIVNDHHDKVRAEEVEQSMSVVRKTETRKAVAKAIAAAVGLLFIGFLLGMQVAL